MWSGKGIWNWLGSFLLLPITEFNFAESWEMGPRMHPSENLLSIAYVKNYSMNLALLSMPEIIRIIW